MTVDYCDQCGTPIAVTPAPTDADAEISSATQVRIPEVVVTDRCPRCDTPRTPGDRYCEVDGHDFEGSDEVVGWCVVVEADRAQFARTSPDDLQFPDQPMTFTCELEGESILVGRRSPSRGVVPDIDLGGAYEDPGVSRRHLRFDRLPDGTYAVVDCDSANGTTINDDATPLSPETPVRLADGDRVHLGAWTTITIVRDRDDSNPDG